MLLARVDQIGFSDLLPCGQPPAEPVFSHRIRRHRIRRHRIRRQRVRRQRKRRQRKRRQRIRRQFIGRQRIGRQRMRRYHIRRQRIRKYRRRRYRIRRHRIRRYRIRRYCMRRPNPLPLSSDTYLRRNGPPKRFRYREREFFIDNLLVRIHSIIEIILVDRPDFGTNRIHHHGIQPQSLPDIPEKRVAATAQW